MVIVVMRVRELGFTCGKTFLLLVDPAGIVDGLQSNDECENHG